MDQEGEKININVTIDITMTVVRFNNNKYAKNKKVDYFVNQNINL